MKKEKEKKFVVAINEHTKEMMEEAIQTIYTRTKVKMTQGDFIQQILLSFKNMFTELVIMRWSEKQSKDFDKELFEMFEMYKKEEEKNE